jgi:hypothetical protein
MMRSTRWRERRIPPCSERKCWFIQLCEDEGQAHIRGKEAGPKATRQVLRHQLNRGKHQEVQPQGQVVAFGGPKEEEESGERQVAASVRIPLIVTSLS